MKFKLIASHALTALPTVGPAYATSYPPKIDKIIRVAKEGRFMLPRAIYSDS
jgi:uncharacterized radical SAM superfamily protein